MQPFAEALRELGLDREIAILPVTSGYPSPKQVNLVLRRVGGLTFLFEASAAKPDIVAEMEAELDRHGVSRLDALLVTHCHGDHAGSAGVLAARSRPAGERAPIYTTSVGYRFLTHPEAAFLQETYEIFLARSQFGFLDYSTLRADDLHEHPIRKLFARYFARTPKRDLRFVDQGQIPDGIVAVPTPGHSNDCVLYHDPALGIAVPGDTILCTGAPGKPETHGFVVPIFTVAGQTYSMAFEGYLLTIRRLRRYFRAHNVRAILPPHGKFAITEPMAWVRFAEGYFGNLFRAFREDFLGDAQKAWKTSPFRACDLSPYLPSAGSHPISTPSHVFGMLCSLADEGWLELSEHPKTRQISFRLLELPPSDHMARRLDEDPGPIPVYRTGRPLS